MRFNPHDYQRRAVEWVHAHPRCLLFLDMGLGKSAVTLTAVGELLRWGETERVLVVAPKKVAESTWSTEAAKWDHLGCLRVVNLTGTETARRRKLREDADVWVIGRDTVAWLEQAMKEEGLPAFDMIVIDELTSFKNPRAIRFKALKRLAVHAERVVGLTGTPTPNGLKDLWAQVNVVDGGARLGHFYTKYRQRYFDCVEKNHIVIRMTPKPGAEEEIISLISDIALTMRKEDYLTLPDILEEDVPVALPEGKMSAYRRFERDRVAEVLSEAGEDPRSVSAASAAALTGKLSQWANGAVYLDDAGGEGDGEFRVLHDEKLHALSEILEADESPLLCFYQFRHDAQRICRHFSELRPRVYSGAEDLADWNAGRIRLLLAHPASTAFGLNMQAGGHRIVWFATGWNLELYQQANARLHRQGQTRPVTVQRLIAQGTVDERMAAALAGKGYSQSQLLADLVESMKERRDT